MVVQHNLSAMNANRYLGINNSKLSKSLEKLSSGYAINRAGDNAAGLAVSEKMRSQIAGMTQAVKNAQDGISMVQTFEGALTETDSILQRMKTLADQMATGSYQDEVDREAAQLEFDQLNDELDQIADTDFNGVVALNGGQMADGTEYVEKNGSKVFDYRSGAAGGATTTAPTGPEDLESKAKLDDSKWTQADATAMWGDLGLTEGTDKEVTITFKKGTNATDPNKATWTVDKAYDKDGNEIKDFDAAKITAAATDNGGLSVKSANSTNSVNAVVDTIGVADDSMVAIKFTNNKDNPIAPTNIGFSDTTDKTAGGVVVDNTDDPTGKLKFTEDLAKTANIAIAAADYANFATDADLQAGVKALNGAKIEATYSGAAGTTTLTPTYTITAAGTADPKLTITAAGEIQYNGKKLATFTPAAVTDDNAAATVKAKGTYTVNVAGYKVPDGAGGFDADIAAAPGMGDANTNTKEPVSTSNAFGKGYNNLTYTDHIVLQVGARSKDAVDFTFKYNSDGIGELEANMDCSSRGLKTNELSLSTAEEANKAIDKIDSAINKVSMVRATFGAVQNRLEHKIDNLNVSVENLTSAESQIRDTNMPQEMMNFTKQQILAQASQSMLAQANQLPQGVLSLLQ